MDEEFIDQVRRALDLARKRQYRELGRLPRLKGLKLVENRMLSSPERSAVYFGKAIMDLLWEAIDELKPPFPEDLNAPVWLIYNTLRDHIKRGEGWMSVADRLGVGGSTFQEIKRDAGELVASTIWAREEQTRLALLPKDNLPADTFIFVKYIERYNQFKGKPIIPGYDKEQRLVEIIIDLLSGKPWIISLEGPPGVGKTSLAYEVGRRCKERTLFEAIIWTSAKKRMLVLQAPSFVLVPFVKPSASCEDILDTIAHELGSRAVSLPNGYAERVETVNKLLRTRNCLIIIDNLEDLTPEAAGQLSIFLRQHRGVSKVILTSRIPMDIGDWPIRLAGMSFDEASRLMELACQRRGLGPLNEEEQRNLYEKTEGTPLAIENILGLMAVKGYSLDLAIGQFKKDETVEEYLWGAPYGQVDEEGKRLLHVMPIFETYSASTEAIGAASRLDPMRVSIGLGTIYRLNFVTKADSRYALRLSAYDFLKGQKEATINGMPIEELLAKAYAGLAKYYIQTLKEKATIDQKLQCLGEGQGEEKWIIMRTLQGCRCLVDFNLEYEECRPHDAWKYIVDLFDLIGHPLGILRYLEDRLRWGEQAYNACQMLGLERKALWFRVFDIGWTHLALKDEWRAKEIFAESLARAREMGYTEVQALALYNMGRMARDEGNLDKASDLFVQSLDLWLGCEPQYVQWIANTKSALGLTKYRQAKTLEAENKRAKLLEAKTLLEESLELRSTIGYTDRFIEGLSDTALVYAALDVLREALKRSDTAIEMGREMIRPPSTALAYALLRRSEVEELLGRIDPAIEYAKKAYALYEALGVKYMLSLAKTYLEHLEGSKKSTNNQRQH
jgi:tetratricopeptide (TPR) repeat protein